MRIWPSVNVLNMTLYRLGLIHDKISVASGIVKLKPELESSYKACSLDPKSGNFHDYYYEFWCIQGERHCWKLTVVCVCVLSSYVFIHLLILNQLHSANKPWFTSSRKAQAFENESPLFSLANGSQLNLIKIYFILPLDFLIKQSKPLMQKSLIKKRKSPFAIGFFFSFDSGEKNSLNHNLGCTF